MRILGASASLQLAYKLRARARAIVVQSRELSGKVVPVPSVKEARQNLPVARKWRLS